MTRPAGTARGRKKENRELIATALDKSMLVEAAAGTGKTTELVGRIVALIRDRRATIREIVAVTFSEKAAGELKLRLREELERARSREEQDAAARLLLEQAIIDFEEAHVSTIHGFCSELLRERPVEARVDPAFAVLTDAQAERYFEEAFTSWIHEQLAAPDEGVRRSLRRPMRWRPNDEEGDGPIERLRKAARELREWRDHDTAWSRPSYDRLGDLKRLMAKLKDFAALTAKPINRGDAFAADMRQARQVSADLDRQRRAVGDMVPDSVYDSWEAALIGLAEHRFFTNPKKGSGAAFAIGVTRQQAHDAHADLVQALKQFRDEAHADVAALLHEEMRECTARYERRKEQAGALDFLDLLIKARDLVRDDPAVRRQFRERFRVILVDEFQDTDPVQGELLRLLTESDTGTLRPGALFIVGDPKQSIYRFRRADVGAYRRISDRLKGKDAVEVTLQTSFRSVPAIQHFVNASFADEMNGDVDALQADYVPLTADRADAPEQPAVIALPVPRPYGFRFGRATVTQKALAESQPAAIAEFVSWMLSSACTWTVEAERGTRRRIQASDVCLLFRRFVHYRDDITRAYVDGLEARGIPHLLVGGKTFHEREEVDAIRTALTAIEWPEDELSVYAALHGPLFSIGEDELLEYHAIARLFHPYRIPIDLPDRLAPIAKALKTLRELHGARNHRPVSDTISRLTASTRAHAGFVLWQGGEQVLANVLQISDLARRYDVEGGLSFRGFVDLLRDTSKRAEAPEAPILEPGTEGVRLMTVHKAKGLEFPVVVLADIGCKLSRDDASRYLDTDRGLCAFRMGDWSPRDLIEHNDQEARRDEAEGVRLAYVAATRARDILVVPAVGDAPHQDGWVRPLNRGLYPPRDQRQSPSTARGVPLFKGKDTVVPDGRADGQQPDESTVRPGAYTLIEPVSQAEYTVVWWDPLLLDAPPKNTRGLRRDDLISRDASPADVAGDRARYEAWREKRARAREAGAAASTHVMTATEVTKQATAPIAVADVAVEDTGLFIESRPSGKRFGTLVHAVLATLPLDANAGDVNDLAALHAKLFAASDEERGAAAAMAIALTRHARWQAARSAAAHGHRVWREVPVSMQLPGDAGTAPAIVDGQVDLAYETEAGWVVIDFKTDIEIASAQEAYKQQVALYADAVAKATGRPATGVLLRV